MVCPGRNKMSWFVPFVGQLVCVWWLCSLLWCPIARGYAFFAMSGLLLEREKKYLYEMDVFAA